MNLSNRSSPLEILTYEKRYDRNTGIMELYLRVLAGTTLIDQGNNDQIFLHENLGLLLKRHCYIRSIAVFFR